MSDCCNAIAADGEAGARCSHTGLMLHRPVMKPIPCGQKAANSMSVPRGKSRHQTDGKKSEMLIENMHFEMLGNFVIQYI